jgi:uncharacterized protein YjbJ (UPF0337 family)
MDGIVMAGLSYVRVESGISHGLDRARPIGQPSCYQDSQDNRVVDTTRDCKEDSGMNADIMEGKWKQMRGQMKEWWGKLTDDDFDVIAGKKDKLVGTLQERYGWAKRDAEDEVARRFRDMDAAAGTTQPAGTTRP